jgi:hypothetical protein
MEKARLVLVCRASPNQSTFRFSWHQSMSPDLAAAIVLLSDGLLIRLQRTYNF